jgi:alkylglycerol monooxygenase
MNPIVYAIPVFMLTILIEALIAWRLRRPLYNVPDALTSLHFGVLSQISGAFLKVLTLGIYLAVYDSYRALDLSMKSPAVWIFALLAYDLAYYFSHRCGHEVGLMWAAHVVHHSSEYFNLSTALRQTSTTALYSWLFYLPLAVVGVPPTVFVVVALIDLLYQYWVHTELIGRLGILDRILVTPSNHRVHHGQNDYCIDCNYGGIFIIWDRIFGSFVEERADEPVVYGIRKPLRSFNPLWGNLHVYSDLLQKSRAQKGLRKKLAVWFAPPGGHLGPDEKLPRFEPASFTRYDPGALISVQRYALLQYVTVALAVSHFIAIAPSLHVASRGIYGLGILISMITVSALLEGNAAARRIEQLRVVAVGVLFATMPRWFGFAASLPIKMSVLILMLLCALWLGRISVLARTRGALA